jgi:AraC-like DNA-binding protein
MDHDQRVVIRFLCDECVSSEDIQAHLEAQFGVANYRERSVRLWCQYVRQGREDPRDEGQPGRLPIDYLDIRILALLDERPFHSVYLIAEALGVSHSTILSRLRELLGMKIFSHVGFRTN